MTGAKMGKFKGHRIFPLYKLWEKNKVNKHKRQLWLSV